jgi:hypothetical protein
MNETMRIGRWLVWVFLALPLAGWPIYGGLSKPPHSTTLNMLPTHWKGQLRDGDILFRRGKEAVSEVVLGLDPRSAYSHVGIVVFNGSETLVVHAVPAEAHGEEDAVKLEPVARFLAADHALGMAVYRLHEAPDHTSVAPPMIAAREAFRLAQAHTPFDSAFDLDTPDQLYCTELVWHVYRKAGIDLAPNPPSKRVLLWSGRYITPSALQFSPLIERVCC